LTLVVVLPTPPFWFATQKIFAMYARLDQDTFLDIYRSYHSNDLYGFYGLYDCNRRNGLYGLYGTAVYSRSI
jgi:hypothetical protein